MENNQQYIKADGGIVINEKCIMWIKKMNACMEVCTKATGCNVQTGGDTVKVCKINNYDSYAKLNKHFE